MSISVEAVHASNAGLRTFQNISIKDFEYFPVETSQGGNASNAGLKKISKYLLKGL